MLAYHLSTSYSTGGRGELGRSSFEKADILLPIFSIKFCYFFFVELVFVIYLHAALHGGNERAYLGRDPGRPDPQGRFRRTQETAEDRADDVRQRLTTPVHASDVVVAILPAGKLMRTEVYQDGVRITLLIQRLDGLVPATATGCRGSFGMIVGA